MYYRGSAKNDRDSALADQLELRESGTNIEGDRSDEQRCRE